MSCEKKAAKSIENITVVLEEEITDLVLRYQNWGELLAPAPLAISILGHLILMSNQKMDFAIDVSPPTNGFKHIKYPKSFRSTLLQISHSGYLAFLKAHTNMDEIRVRNSAIPAQIKSAVRYLLSKNEKVIELRLPSTLATIKEIVNKSEVLSREIVNEFTLVIELIGETVSALVSTKGDAQIKLDEVGLNRNLTEMEKKFSEEESAVLEEKKAKLNGLRKRLDHRKDNMMIRTLYSNEDFTINLSKGDWLSQAGGRHERHHDIFFKQGSWIYTFHDESVESNACAQKNSQPLQDLIVAFGVYRTGYENWQKSEIQRSTHFDGAKTIQTFQRLAGDLDICSDIAEIAKKCANLIKYLKTVNYQSIKKTESRPGAAQIDEIILLVKDVRAADKITEKATGNSTTHKATNLMEMWSISYQRQKKMINDMATATIQIIALNNKQMEIRRAKTELILQRISSLDATKVHYTQVLQALTEGLKELGKLKEDWDKLIRFFTNVRLFIDSATVHSMALIEITRTLSKDRKLLEDEVTFQDLLINIEKSNEAVFLVHSIAAMYVNVSNTYIMDRVASLDTLNTMVIQGESDDVLNRTKKNLSDNAMVAFEGIKKFVLEDEKRLREKLNERHIEIQKDYNWVWDCRDSKDVEYPELASIDGWYLNQLFTRDFDTTCFNINKFQVPN